MAMTAEEARANQIPDRETPYCYVLACAWEGIEKDSICLERIFTKERGCEEIRLAWWSNGGYNPRSADIDAPDWVTLFAKAIKAGVFTETEQFGMLKALLK